MTLRDLRTGSLTQHTVQAGARFMPVDSNGSTCSFSMPTTITTFMDTDSFDQIVLSPDD